MSKEKHIFCLIKFFSNKEYLDYLLQGRFYCNTPEFYRNFEGEGVGDINESCISSFRKGRSDFEPTITIKGLEAIDITSATLHGNEKKEKWMHCWFALTKPESDEEFEQFICNIKRMRDEFGKHFAIIDAVHISKLVEAIETSSGHNVYHGLVEYSDNRPDWSSRCKSSEYAYQQEYRFLIGNCNHLDKAPLKFKLPKNCYKLVTGNSPLQMADNKTGELLFKLTSENLSSIQINEGELVDVL